MFLNLQCTYAGPYQSSGGQSRASQLGGPDSIRRQFMCDLWWKN